MRDEKSRDRESPRLKEVEETKTEDSSHLLLNKSTRTSTTGEEEEQDDPDSESITTIDDAIERAGFGFFQHKLILICVCVFMADAMEIMLLSFLQVLIREEWNLSSSAEASITAAVFIGELPGSLFWGILGDRVGRRIAFILSALVVAVAGIASAFSTSFTSLVLLRGIVGFGVAGGLIPFDIIAEFTPESHRHRVMLFVQYSWTLGIVFVALLAWLVIEPLGWRWLTALCSMPLCFALVLSPQLPESPKWLEDIGRMDEAVCIVTRMAQTNEVPDFPLLDPIVLQKHQRHSERTSSAGLDELWSDALKKKTRLFVLIWFGFGLTYYGVVLFTPRLFATDQEVKDDENNHHVRFDYTSILFSTLAEFIGVTCAILVIDKIGLKMTQATAYLFGCVPLFLLGFSMSPTADVLFAMAARASIMAGSAATWVASPLAFPTHIRATAHGAFSSMARVGGFITPFIADADSLSILTISVIYSSVLCITTWAAFALPRKLDAFNEEEIEPHVRLMMQEKDNTPVSSSVPLAVEMIAIRPQTLE